MLFHFNFYDVSVFTILIVTRICQLRIFITNKSMKVLKSLYRSYFWPLVSCSLVIRLHLILLTCVYESDATVSLTYR